MRILAAVFWLSTLQLGCIESKTSIPLEGIGKAFLGFQKKPQTPDDILKILAGDCSNCTNLVAPVHVPTVVAGDDYKIVFPTALEGFPAVFYYAPKELIHLNGKQNPADLPIGELNKFYKHVSQIDKYGVFNYSASTHGEFYIFIAIPLSPGKIEVSPILDLTVFEDFRDSEGWTQFEPSNQTKVIYVSKDGSSTGCNRYDLGHPQIGPDPRHPIGNIAACNSISEALGLLENSDDEHTSDYVLFKRGDVFHEGIGLGKSSGVSKRHPLLISYYGSMDLPRPKFMTNGKGVNVGSAGQNIAVVGLHFVRTAPDTEYPVGIHWTGDGDYFLVEDCFIDSFKNNITILGGGITKDVRIRRNTIVNAYAVSKRSQGLYVDDVDGLLVEGNFLDHNGYHPSIPGAGATTENRNAYLTVHNKSITYRNNITTRSSSEGVQQRPGGIMVGNFSALNAAHANFGLVNGGSDPEVGGSQGYAIDNVTIDGSDINNQLKRGYGIVIANIKRGFIANNLFANNVSSSDTGRAIGVMGDIGKELDWGVHNLVIANNQVYNWPKQIAFINGDMNPVDLDEHGNPEELSSPDFKNVEILDNLLESPTEYTKNRGILVLHGDDQDMSEFTYRGNTYFTVQKQSAWFEFDNLLMGFSDWLGFSDETGATQLSSVTDYPAPDRNMASYCAHLQSCSGNTNEAFIQRMKEQRRGNWDLDYTAGALNQYIRDGFSN